MPSGRVYASVLESSGRAAGRELSAPPPRPPAKHAPNNTLALASHSTRDDLRLTFLREAPSAALLHDHEPLRGHPRGARTSDKAAGVPGSAHPHDELRPAVLRGLAFVSAYI